jgi:hypothetical protein
MREFESGAASAAKLCFSNEWEPASFATYYRVFTHSSPEARGWLQVRSTMDTTAVFQGGSRSASDYRVVAVDQWGNAGTPSDRFSSSSIKTDDGPGPVVLSNTGLPRDVHGRPLITGETSVATVNGTHYFYVNNWGNCSSIDCCASSAGCASCCFVPPTKAYPDPCIFADGHEVLVYATRDLLRWQPLGVALALTGRLRGIEFRPHVVFCRHTSRWVMWYEDRPLPRPGHKFDSKGYNVALSSAPHGPFTTVATAVVVADVPGDFDLLVDDDGTAYHIQTTTNDPSATRGFAITVLDESYTRPALPRRSSSFVAPLPAEGPVFFKHAGSYYVLGGTTCCACRGGSSIYVFRSESPLGPWHFQADVGSNPGPFDKHSPNSFVTHAQASAVFETPVGSGQLVWLGNQWVSSAGSVRNADLLYWSVLEFDVVGNVQQFRWQPNCTVTGP